MTILVHSTILVTFDVKGLFTSIHHVFGINFWTGKHPHTLHTWFSRESVFKSIKTILEFNTCMFNIKLYKHISGAAMGTVFPLTFATK